MNKKTKEISEGKNKWKNMAFSFSTIMIAGFFLTLSAIFISHGRLFSHIFFHDRIDTGMDFFHSIEYTYGRMPYVYWHTIYPPLANFFFYLLLRCIPPDISNQWAKSFEDSIMARGSSIDLRTSQSIMMLYIFFIISTVLLLNCIVKSYLAENGVAEWVAISIIFSYGMLYAYERGNIVILSFLCTMFFVFFRHSMNKYIRETALIMLAIAAGLKIYPAVFGILLLYDREYAKACRTILYGILFFILPCFIFVEGLDGIRLMFKELSQFTVQERLLTDGYSADRILNSIILFFADVFSISVDTEIIKTVGQAVNILFPCVLLISGFVIKSEWHRTLICSMSMLLYSSQSIYATIFLAIPILVLIHDESSLNRKNVLGFILLTFMLAIFPTIDITIKNISLKYVRYQLGMVMLTVYILRLAIKTIVHHRFDLQNIHIL